MTKLPRYQHADPVRRYAVAYARMNAWIMVGVSIAFAGIAIGAFANDDWLYGTLLFVFIGVGDVGVFVSLRGIRRRNR
jgi:hypothetical protein